MPDFIVTQTAKEYADYKKKQDRKMIRGGLIALCIFLGTCSFIYWFLYE